MVEQALLRKDLSDIEKDTYLETKPDQEEDRNEFPTIFLNHFTTLTN